MNPRSIIKKAFSLDKKSLIIMIALLSCSFLACTNKGLVKKVQASEAGAEVNHESDDVSVDNTYDYWFGLGSSYVKETKFREAKEAFKEAVRLSPGSAEALYHLGQAYRELGDLNHALRAFEEAARLNPEIEEVQYRLGLVNMELGLEQAALQAFTDVLRINPRNADAHFNIGKLYLKMRLKKEAKQAFLDAVKIRPDFAEAHYQLGSIYIMFNDIGPAFDQYRILIDLDRNLAYKLFNQIYK